MNHSTQAHNHSGHSDPGTRTILKAPTICWSTVPPRPPKSPERYSETLSCSDQPDWLTFVPLAAKPSRASVANRSNQQMTSKKVRRMTFSSDTSSPSRNQPVSLRRRTISAPELVQPGEARYPNALAADRRSFQVVDPHRSVRGAIGKSLPVFRLTRSADPPLKHIKAPTCTLDSGSRDQSNGLHRDQTELDGLQRERRAKFIDRVASSSSLRNVVTHLYRLAPTSPRIMQSDPRFSQWDTELGVEIPRFKKRELQLGILHTPHLRSLWMLFCFARIFAAHVIIFLDINTFYLLLQCTLYPSFGANSKGTWAFASAAYALCCFASVLVTFAWGFGFEYWRRWRLARPAIEPIHFSLNASCNLSLFSFHHFGFLLHKDIIPETCHAVVQLFPGVLAVVPRAAIALVLLIAYWRPAVEVALPLGAQDLRRLRDTGFFRKDGSLSPYARNTLLAFVAYVGLRIATVLFAALALWIFSSRRFGPNPSRRMPKSSLPQLDPSLTVSPRRHWLSEENGHNSAWRDRSVARIQDAFELCLMRGSSQPRSQLNPPISLSHVSPSNPYSFPGSPPPTGQGRLSLRDVEDPLFPPHDHLNESSMVQDDNQIRDEAAPPSAFRPAALPGMQHRGDLPTISHRPRSTSTTSSKDPSPRSIRTSSMDKKRSFTSNPLKRARASSVTQLQQATNAGARIIRKARSGTLLSVESGYFRISDEPERV